MRKTKIKNLAAALAALGFLLTLTEFHGGPWAGTYIGAALFILGALAALRIKTEGKNSKGTLQHAFHRALRRTEKFFRKEVTIRALRRL